MNKHNLSISNFSKAIGKILIVGIIVILCCLHIMPQYHQGYLASVIDKEQRLKSIEEAKIVLIGDSNLTFGIDSEMIEEAMGMPVVNMGLHGGLGNDFHEKMAIQNVNEGDIYIICHTDYSNDEIINPLALWLVMEDNFHLWSMLDGEALWQLYHSFPAYLKNCIDLYVEGEGNQEVTGSVYRRGAFNKYGDIEVARNQGTYVFTEESVKVPSISKEGIERINALNDYLGKQGATLLIAGYPIAYGEYTPDKEKYVEFQEELEKQMNCPVISDFTDYMYEYEYFFDTELHLTSEGASRRTGQLITDLQTWLD